MSWFRWRWLEVVFWLGFMVVSGLAVIVLNHFLYGIIHAAN